MNPLDLLQALAGILPGQGANRNSGQGAQATPGGGLFGPLLGQQLGNTAQNIQPGGPGVAPGVTGAPAISAGDRAAEGSPNGASILLQIPAGAAAEEALLASIAFSAGGDGAGNGTGAQLPSGQASQASSDAAIAQSPVVLAGDGEAPELAAGPQDQDVLDSFQAISPNPGGAAEAAFKAGIDAGKLPGQAEAGAAAAPSGNDEIEAALAMAPGAESVAAAAKGLGPAEAPAAGREAPARGDVAAADAQRAIKAESNGQPRAQLLQKGAGEARVAPEGDTTGSGNGSGNSDRQGDQEAAAGRKNFTARAGAKSGYAPGIKTSLGNTAVNIANIANINAAASARAGLLAAGQGDNLLQSHLTPLKAIESSMALQAGLVLPFDGSAAADPMTGAHTAPSAQAVAGGIHALQAGLSLSSPAHSAASFAHAPNFAAHQVGLQITRAIADGQNEFTIRLNPPELGRVEVRLDFRADGGVRAALSAEKPETLALLQRDAAALERALNDAGVRTDAGSLNFSLQQGEAHDWHERAESAGGPASVENSFDDGLLPAAEIEISEQVIQQMIADGTVDIRV